MLNRLILCLIFTVLIFSANAQSTYSSKNLRQLSSEELFLYYQKSSNLERKGEIIALTGGVVGLLGILAGVIVTDNNSSDRSSDLLVATSAAMITGGSIATIVGFTMYMTGASRISRINNIQHVELLRMELIPGTFYSMHTQKYQPGVTLRICF